MFYVKSKLTEETEINIEITDENVFTRCPNCGVEISVDIVEESRSEDFDLFGTALYCPKCSERICKSASC